MFLSVRFIYVIKQFQVTIGINCWALTRDMNVSYVVGHEQSFVTVCHVYSVSIDNILGWVCEVYTI
jgi:hypothetical protein